MTRKNPRTIHVELPDVKTSEFITTNGYTSLLTLFPNGRIWLESGDHVFCILPEEAEKFALTILAMHQQNQENTK